mgnify:FL=1|tara:strand:- start:919 stop:1608 length:690 start_codon:yes stop_codon:yes gene_type:complete
MNIAIIPARSGSKRIKNKNIKKFHGKPIIAWSILEALKAKVFDKVIVSTDSEKIATIARNYGAVTPYLRSKKLSNDKTNLPVVVEDCIQYFLNKNIKINYACLIYATSPLIDKKDIIKGSNLIKKNKYDFVISVSKFESSVQRAVFLKNNIIYPQNKKYILTKSQKLKEMYYDNGQFTFGTTKAWLSKKHTFFCKSSIVEIPSIRSQDIDNIDDWKKAEILFKLNKKIK